MRTIARVRAGLILAAGVFLCLLSANAGESEFERLKARAELGYIQDQHNLGRAYLIGRGVEPNPSLAAFWYEKAAHSGDPVSQRIVGCFYKLGFGVRRDLIKAHRWLQRSMAGGSLDAKVDLAADYLSGNGVRKDVALSMRWLKEAADKGDARAEGYLGDIYEFGVGTPIDKTVARQWYEKGVSKGDTISCYRLGLVLLNDPPEKRDTGRAIDLLRKAAAGGLIAAKLSLGLSLAHNPDRVQTADESATALEEAASAGTWRASLFLGVYAYNGTLGPRDRQRAYFWLQIAILQGGEEARRLSATFVDSLTRELGTAETGDLDAKAKQWFEKHSVPYQFIGSPHDAGQNPVSIGIAAVGGTHVNRMDVMPKEEPDASPF